MAENRVDATLKPADAQAVLSDIADIKTKLPFLIDLSIEERKSLPKLGDNSRAFVQKALEVASQNTDFLPRSFDTAEMQRDWELFQALSPIAQAVAQLNELLDDTITEVGSEAYGAALVVYNSLKANGKGSALDGELDALAQRFARKSAGNRLAAATLRLERGKLRFQTATLRLEIRIVRLEVGVLRFEMGMFQFQTGKFLL